MNFAAIILNNKKLILSVFGIFAFLGLLSWFTMPREEDPRMAERFGSITILYPGATPEHAEKFAAKPVEDELSSISKIDWLATTVRSGVVQVTIRLKDKVARDTAISDAWRDIQEALNRAALEFPEGVLSYELDHKLMETDAYVFAVGGSKDLLVLKEAADKLKDAMLSVPLVARVKLYADPGEQVSIRISDEQASRSGLSISTIAAQLQSANMSLAAGSLASGSRSLSIQTNSTFKSLEEIKAFPVLLSSGQTIPLGSLAFVEKTTALPKAESMFYNGEEVVGVGVIPEEKSNILYFDKNVRNALSKFEKENHHVKVFIANAQPDYVRARLRELSGSLVAGVVTVGIVLLLGMGLRVGILVSIMLPVISMVSLALYALSGGVLNQISIAALVMALGILIDNIIVITESIQEKIDAGEDAVHAAGQTIREFAMPLFSSTGTTIAAFLPMLGSSGDTADFTKAIPVINIFTLIVSYLFAVFVTPSVALSVLRKGEKNHLQFLESAGEWIGKLVVRSPWRVLASVFALLLLLLGFMPFMKMKFFPSADRNQLIVDIEFPAGTHFSYTEERSLAFEKELKKFPEIEKTVVFAGRGTPRFYYNLKSRSNSPHISQILVITKNFKTASGIRSEIQLAASNFLPNAEVIVRKLEQGPPVDAPVEVRLYSKSSEEVIDAAEILVSSLRALPSTENVRSDAGIGVPVARFEVADASAMQYGLSRSAVTSVLQGRLRGMPAGNFRGSEDSIPVRIMSYEGEKASLDQINQTYLTSTMSGDVLMSSIASPIPDWEKSIIHRRNRERVVSVLAELREGYAINEVIPQVNQILRNIPASVRIEIGGEQSESAQSGGALAAAMPLGMTLLLLFLLMEFRSYRKLMIVMATVPAALVGIIPALVLSGQPFGFLSLLGGMALIGIVVNNGILLLSYVEERKAAGEDPLKALSQAVARRIRPIFLTTATTTAGMLPLAFTEATLWPPFAWAMIGGLFVSTTLALLAVPALYKVIFLSGSNRFSFWKKGVAAAILLGGGSIFSQEIQLSEALSMAEKNSDAILARLEAEKTDRASSALFLSTWFPHVNASGSYNYRDQELNIQTPFGDLEVGSTSYLEGGISVQQNLFDPANMMYEIPAAASSAKAAKYMANWQINLARLKIVLAWTAVAEWEIRIKGMDERILVLREQRAELNRNFRFGRVSRTDLILVETALEEALLLRTSMESRKSVALQELSFLLDKSVKEISTSELESFVFREYKLGDLQRQLESRYDLRAVQEQEKAASLRRDSILWEPLPRAWARGTYEYSEASLYKEKGFSTVSIGATIPLVQGGSRIPRYLEKEAERKITSEKKRALVRSSLLELESAWEDYQTSLSEAKQYSELAAKTVSIAQISRNEFEQGKRSLSEYIEAAKAKTEWAEKSRLSRLAAIRASARLEFASGLKVFSVTNQTAP